MDKCEGVAFAILQELSTIASSCIAEELEGLENEERAEVYSMTIDVQEALNVKNVLDEISASKCVKQVRKYASFEMPSALMLASPIFRGVQKQIEHTLN